VHPSRSPRTWVLPPQNAPPLMYLPASILIRVDLPPPLSPSRARISSREQIQIDPDRLAEPLGSCRGKIGSLECSAAPALPRSLAPSPGLSLAASAWAAQPSLSISSHSRQAWQPLPATFAATLVRRSCQTPHGLSVDQYSSAIRRAGRRQGHKGDPVSKPLHRRTGRLAWRSCTHRATASED